VIRQTLSWASPKSTTARALWLLKAEGTLVSTPAISWRMRSSETGEPFPMA
jgi:hypothetical protein